MKDITNLTAIQTCIFQTDAIPVARLLLNDVRQHLAQGLGFKAANVDEKQAIQFGAGEFVHDGRVHLIEAVVFEDRRISLKLQASTAVVAACFETLLGLLAEQDSAVRSPALTTSHDCSFVASLDFDFREIFIPAVRGFIERALPEGLADEHDLVLAPRTFSLDVQFPQTATMAELYMTKQGRPFAIEPRALTSLAERRYYCTGPTDSETLMGLVREFEASVVRSR